MKAASLLFLRISTGLLLILWGVIKIAEPTAAVGVSDTYYGGVVSMAALQAPWGAVQIATGILVILGLLRRYIYPLQAVMLCIGALAISKYLLDPFGMYLLSRDDSQILFFPSLCVAAATLVLIAFRGDDALSLDAKIAT